MPVSEALLAAQARLYLGDPYSDAIGLPAVSRLHTLVALLRLALFRVFFGVYFVLGTSDAAPSPSCFARLGAAVHSRVIRVVYRAIMRRSFAALVSSVRASQPACRFGKSLDGSSGRVPIPDPTPPSSIATKYV